MAFIHSGFNLTFPLLYNFIISSLNLCFLEFIFLITSWRIYFWYIGNIFSQNDLSFAFFNVCCEYCTQLLYSFHIVNTWDTQVQTFVLIQCDFLVLYNHTERQFVSSSQFQFELCVFYVILFFGLAFGKRSNLWDSKFILSSYWRFCFCLFVLECLSTFLEFS